jgi:hypothetical protein
VQHLEQIRTGNQIGRRLHGPVARVAGRVAAGGDQGQGVVAGIALGVRTPRPLRNCADLPRQAIGVEQHRQLQKADAKLHRVIVAPSTPPEGAPPVCAEALADFNGAAGT